MNCRFPSSPLPGTARLPAVTNVILDHRRAAELSLRHLHQLGHRHIAFMRGQSFSSDSDDRWRSLVAVSQGTWDRNSAGADDQVGAGSDFTGAWLPRCSGIAEAPQGLYRDRSFNDIAAIGAIRALRDANLRVPEDVSVIGFDDIQVAAYHNPRLTTIRQPLHDMGETAARILLQRMQGFKDYPMELAVPPELIIRETTAAPNAKALRQRVRP